MLFLWLVFLQIIIFAILVLFLRVILKRNLVTATTHLSDINKDYTQKLDDAKKRLQEADRYYDEAVLKAKTDVEKLKAQILKEAHESQEAAVAESRKQGTEIVQQANKAAELLMKDIDRQVDERAIDRGGELAEQVLTREISKELHHKWLGELFKNGLDELAKLHLPKDLAEAKVVSAYPLTADEKALITKKIKEHLKCDLKLVEQADPSLIAGLKMSLGSVVIDGTIRFKLKESARHAKHSS